MRISIFNLNSKETYKDEYTKIIKILNSKCTTYKNKTYTYFEFVNNFLFNNWKFRSTYLDVYDYLNFIGVNINSRKITETSFINLLEFLLNMNLLLSNIKPYYNDTKFSTKARSILYHNIPIILERLNLEAYDLDDRIVVSSIDANYNDLKDTLPSSITELIVMYKSINNNSIKIKRMILDKLFDYLEKNQDKYKSYNSSIYTTIKQVVNKMGVRYEIDKKYKDLSNYKLRKYYDYIFSMICYLLNTENIYKYRDYIKNK